MQTGPPVRIPATRTSSNLVADALISGIIKVRILHTAFSYFFLRIGAVRISVLA